MVYLRGMADILELFPPTRDAAKSRLDAFVPRAAAAYAQGRNFDHGAGQHDAVSTLSPYIRARLLDEPQVARAVIAKHRARDADKFLSEVFWRTYWKGWMELRPSVWQMYRSDLTRLQDEVQTQSGLRARWEDACLGQTGIAPFDAWAHELVQTGYLHNHARMWFASIWIFTLGLPWQLGADFFLRHLLDGDAAVNTLSWRWVAGIQTQGKTYLATEGNIAKFTNGRFASVPDLADHAPAISYPPNPSAGMLPPAGALPRAARFGVMLHGDDTDPAPLIKGGAPAAWAYAEATSGHSPWQMAPHVSGFRQVAARDQADGAEMAILEGAEAIAGWATSHALEQIVAPYAPVGPVQDMIAAYRARPDALPVSLHRRPFEDHAWSLATKGFFPFRKHIPDLINRFVREQGAFNLV
ncbi:FAD-binding domain-containing protein [Sulfitobacter sp. JB4-11]|uniref:FAD-binding domain-containing protein n=1 Tax=Sulfitobacter rhodophyticola TaxID=3238304 RepID=UPI003D816DB7